MASSEVSDYNIVADYEDGENEELVRSFIDVLHQKTESWGFKVTSDRLGRTWFEQLQEDLDITNVTIVIILPNHDQRSDKAQYAIMTALMKTFRNRGKCVIPICLNGGRSQHFDIYTQMEFRDNADWEKREKWLKLKEALEERCRPTSNNLDCGLASPIEDADAMEASRVPVEIASNATRRVTSSQHNINDSKPIQSKRSDFFTGSFFNHISDKIAADWWKLAIRLGLEHHVITEIEHNNRGQLCEKTTTMLLRWKSSLYTDRERECANILCGALRAEKINDLANDVHNSYKDFSGESSALKNNSAEIDKSTTNDIFLLELAGRLPEKWQVYCSSLGLVDAKLKCFAKNYEGDTHRQAFQALVMWRSQAGDLSEGAKIGWLVKVFREESRIDIVEWITGKDPMSMSSDEWKIYYHGNTEDGEQKLLTCNVILDQSTLEFACSNLGRCSEAMKAVCDRICVLFKRRPGVTQAWPAYAYTKGDRGNDGNVTFIIITKNIEHFDDEGYKCHIRSPDEIDNRCKLENEKIKQEEIKNLWLMDDLQDVDVCINIQSEEFMAQYKHCLRIARSPLKSIGYMTDNPKLFKQKCIALYVRIKGYIPLDEKPFPLKIGKFDVDVREGLYVC